MNIESIVNESHAIAISKGWHEIQLCEVPGDPARGSGPSGVNYDAVARAIALIHSEITEAWDCVVMRSERWPWQEPMARPTERRYAWDPGTQTWRDNRYYLAFDPKGKPEGLVAELADVVIRIADLCGALGLPLAQTCKRLQGSDDLKSQGRSLPWNANTEGPSGRLLAMHALADRALEALRCSAFVETRLDIEPVYSVVETLAALVGECVNMLFDLETLNPEFDARLDIEAAIAAKMEYNRKREYRHGGKAI